MREPGLPSQNVFSALAPVIYPHLMHETARDMESGLSFQDATPRPISPCGPNEALADLIAHQPALAENLLKLMVGDAKLGVWLVDDLGCTLLVSQGMALLLAQTVDQLMKRRPAHVVFDQDQALFAELMAHQSGTEARGRFRFVRPDGEVRWAEVRCHILQHGNAPGFPRVLLVEDETERLKTDAAVRESEFIFRSQFEHGNIGMALTSPSKGWISANAKLCEMLQYPEAELKQLDWAVLTHPDDLARDVAQFTRLLAGEIDGYELDKRFLRKDGTAVMTHLTVSSYRRVPGPYEYVIASIQDITDGKRTEAQLQFGRVCVFQQPGRHHDCGCGLRHP